MRRWPVWAVEPRPLRRAALRALPAFVALWACGACSGPPTELSTLVLRDSTYLSPVTLEPFTGNVVRHFASDARKTWMEGHLEQGVWEGELTVYHPDGRIRYQGRLSGGAPYGAWVENRDDEPPGSIYEELVQEIEAMGLYPPCPEDG